jgi:hypothetical protein
VKIDKEGKKTSLYRSRNGMTSAESGEIHQPTCFSGAEEF